MTTNINIVSGCGKEKEVSVVITEKGVVVESFALQDQETTERAVWDGMEISIKEIYKVTSEERSGCLTFVQKGMVLCNGEKCEHYRKCFDK